MKQKNKRLEEFAFTNSHVLRAPVSLILGYAQLIADIDNTHEEVQGFGEIVFKKNDYI